MKKIFSLILMVSLVFTLAACGGDTDPSDDNGSNGSNGNNGDNGDNGNGDNDVEQTYDLQGQEFIIFVDSPNTTDPRDDRYNGLNQSAKAALIEEVEARYNIQVVYRAYPSNATWGGARNRWIVNNVVSGSPQGHIYEMPSTSIPELADAGAILDLSEYMDIYGSPDFPETKKEFGRFLDGFYTYDDYVPMNENGIFYNMELLADLGFENDLPTQMWLDGEWDWTAFETLAKDIDAAIADRDDHYVIGGRTYNWAYGMVHANGGHLINDQLEIGLLESPAFNTIQFIADLYEDVAWRSESSLSNTVEQEFVEGRIVFHNGSYWHTFNESRFGNRSWGDIGFVPYPTGDNTEEDLSNYGNMLTFGPRTYLVSRGYEKENIPAGYEDFFIHDELIFQIWSEMQYFGNIDETYLDFQFELYQYYANDASVDAHVSVLQKINNDLFYALGTDVHGHVEGSVMIQLEGAIKDNEVRSTLEAIHPILESLIEDRFSE